MKFESPVNIGDIIYFIDKRYNSVEIYQAKVNAIYIIIFPVETKNRFHFNCYNGNGDRTFYFDEENVKWFKDKHDAIKKAHDMIGEFETW